MSWRPAEDQKPGEAITRCDRDNDRAAQRRHPADARRAQLTA
jgi:hypothetical protein